MIPLVLKGASNLINKNPGGKGKGFANVLKKSSDILNTYQRGKAAQAAPKKAVVRKPLPAAAPKQTPPPTEPKKTFNILGAEVPKPVVYIGGLAILFLGGRAIYEANKRG